MSARKQTETVPSHFQELPEVPAHIADIMAEDVCRGGNQYNTVYDDNRSSQ